MVVTIADGPELTWRWVGCLYRRSGSPVVHEQVEVCVPRGKDSRPGTLVVDAGSRPQTELTVNGWSPQEIIGYLTGKNSTRGGDR